LKKPAEAIEKPALRTSFAASVAASAPIGTVPPVTPRFMAASKNVSPAAPAAATSTEKLWEKKIEGEKKSDGEKKGESEKAAVTTPADWGLSTSKRRGGSKLKLAGAALALTAAAGGYLVWSQMFSENSGGDADGAQLAQTAEPNGPEPETDSLEAGDPFDDAPAVRPAGNLKTATTPEPRRMGNSPDATPINPRGIASRKKKNPLSESLELDGEEISDLSADAAQSEPEAGDGPSGPALIAPGDGGRRRAAAGQANASRTMPAKERRQATSGPRLSAADDSDVGQFGEDLSDEKFDGYSVDEKRTPGRGKETSGAPSVSIVEIDDDSELGEQLDGYVPQNATTRRATSKTVVVRGNDSDGQPASAGGARPAAGRRDPAERIAAFDDEDLDDAPRTVGRDASQGFARPAQGDGDTLRRRSAPPVPSADRRLSSALPKTQSTGPDADSYRVQPDDNFWKISRKLYGTARYYQALMRYNQERVPDPQKLRPGTQILTPPAGVLEQRFPDLIEKSSSGAATSAGGIDRSTRRPGFEQPSPADDLDEATERGTTDAGSSGYFYGPSGEPLYKIGPDDTLTGIAQRHLGRASRWTEIYEKNQDVLQSPDNLTLGTVIRLPADASRVGLAPDRDRRR
jgi:nucleoid-associated protein YgaU